MESYSLLRTRRDTFLYYLSSTVAKIVIAVAVVCLLGCAAYITWMPWLNSKMNPEPVVTQIVQTPDPTDVMEQAEKLADAKATLTAHIAEAQSQIDKTSDTISKTDGQVTDNKVRQEAQSQVKAVEKKVSEAKKVTGGDIDAYTKMSSELSVSTDTLKKAYDTMVSSHDTWSSEQKKKEETEQQAAQQQAATQQESVSQQQSTSQQQSSTQQQAATQQQSTTQQQTTVQQQPVVQQPASTGMRISVSCDRSSTIQVVGSGSITANGAGVASGGTATGTRFSLATTGNSLSWSWVSGGNCS